MDLTFAQLEGKCYCCGKPGHKSPQCAHKDKPKPEWWINKAQQHLQKQAPSENEESSNNNSNTEQSSDDTKAQVAWMNMHVAHVQLLHF